MARALKSMRPGLLLGIIALSALLTACSFKTLYNRMDYLMVAYVEGMVTLDDALESDLEKRVSLLIKWHRTTQLQAYADWLKMLQADAGPELDEETLKRHDMQLETFLRSILLQLNTEMAGFLPQLNTRQREELFKSLEEKNEDFYEKYINLTRAERIERYVDRLTDTYEDWLGDLDKHQQRAIVSASVNIQSSAARRLELRKLWQSKIGEILESDDRQGVKSRKLQEYIDRFEVMRDSGVKPAAEANRALIRKLTIDIVRSMSNEQKVHFIEHSNYYIRMFTELSSESSRMPKL